MTTEAQKEANRRNAQRSTGPKTTEGKARSARNSTKHGLTAQAVVLPNEDSDVFKARLDHWLSYYATSDPAQLSLIHRAVHASWRLDRCAGQERAVVAERVRNAHIRHDLKRQNEAESLGMRLLYEPINRDEEYAEWRDPQVAAFLAKRAADNPTELYRVMCSFSEGVEWLYQRWVRLKETLERDGYWHHNDQFVAIRLLGKRPEDLLDDPVLGEIAVLCYSLHTQSHRGREDKQDMYDHARRAALGVQGKPMYYEQVDGLRKYIPVDRRDANHRLIELVRVEIAKLEALKVNVLDPVAELDRDEAAQRAMLDDGPAAELRRRYEGHASREFHRSVNDLMKLRKEAAKSGLVEMVFQDEPEAAAPVEANPAEAEAPIEANSAAEAEAETPIEANSEPRPASRKAMKRQKRAQQLARSANQEMARKARQGRNGR